MSDIFIPDWESVKKKIDKKDSKREKLKLIWMWIKSEHINFAQFDYILNYINEVESEKEFQKGLQVYFDEKLKGLE